MPNSQKSIRVILGDITTLQVDAIVNSANQSLLGGAGVDRAIHRAAGRGILDECLTFDGCPVGESRLTKGYNLPAKYVIHAVGPMWMGGWDGEDEKLTSAYRSALDIAQAQGFKSVAFPCISRGVHRYPIKRAAEIAITTVKAHPYAGTVIFCCRTQEDYLAYAGCLRSSPTTTSSSCCASQVLKRLISSRVTPLVRQNLPAAGDSKPTSWQYPSATSAARKFMP